MARVSLTDLPGGVRGAFWSGGGARRVVLDPDWAQTKALLARVLGRFPGTAANWQHAERGLSAVFAPGGCLPIRVARYGPGFGTQHLVGCVHPRVVSAPAGPEATMLAVESGWRLRAPLVFASGDEADRFAAGLDQPIAWQRYAVEVRVRSALETVLWAVAHGHDSEQAPPPRTDLEALLDQALQRDEIRAARARARVPA